MNTTTTTTTTPVVTADIPTSAAELAVIEKTAVDRLNKSLAKTSLDDFLSAERRSLLLVDCSSSMRNVIRTGGTRIDALRKVVEDLRETHPVPVAELSGRGVNVVERVPTPTGGTPLADALHFGKAQGATHLVVVADGEPNSEADAFDAARAFGGAIDTFYIGDGNTRGSRFMAELAAMTGGTAHLTDLGAPKQLVGKIAGLLGDGSF